MDDAYKEELLEKVFPVIFTDGRDFFRRLMSEYVVHKKGLFILGPSGSGKTHYVKNQVQKDFIDGDKMWNDSKAAPDIPWWTMGVEVINRVDQRSDVITKCARDLGLWVLGASQFWLKPDGIVLPDWEKHKEYIIHRETHNYDGGATSKDYDQVLGHREIMEKLAARENIPIFQSIEEAVEALSKDTG